MNSDLKTNENEYKKRKKNKNIALLFTIIGCFVYIVPGIIIFFAFYLPAVKKYQKYCPKCHEYNDELHWKYAVLHSQERSRTNQYSKSGRDQWTRYRVKFTVNCEHCDYAHSFHRDININYESSKDITEVLEKQLKSIGVGTKS